MTRPICTSVYSDMAAYTSAMRLNRAFSSALSVSHGRTASSWLNVSSRIGLSGVSAVSCGRMPLSIMRASAHSR